MRGETNLTIKLFMISVIFASEHYSSTLSISGELYQMKHSSDTSSLQRFSYRCQNITVESFGRCVLGCISGFGARFVSCAGLAYDHDTKQCGICGQHENYLYPALNSITDYGGIVFISEYLNEGQLISTFPHFDMRNQTPDHDLSLKNVLQFLLIFAHNQI